MYSQRLEARPLMCPPEPFDGVQAYARAKRAQVALAPIWAERLRGARVSVSTMHPGWVATPGVSRSLPRFDRALRHRLRSPEEGADTVLFLMIAERAHLGAGAPAGAFWFDREPAPPHLLPWTRGGDEPADLYAQLDRLVGMA
jgi:NAD(P)-dependent dehydrogenase (short-subunit alcohol dehydrogenase family)